MLFYLFNALHASSETLSFLRLMHYLSFRAIAAAITAFLLTTLLGRRIVEALYRRGMRDVIRDYGSLSNEGKGGTPTMGGLIIILAVLTGVILWCDLSNPFIPLLLLSFVWFGGIGAADDYLKCRNQNSDMGLSQRAKSLAQGGFGLLLGLLCVCAPFSPIPPHLATKLYVPMVKLPVMDLSWAYIPFIALTVYAIANSVNFADGLDGLAIVPVGFVAVVYGVFAYVIGNTIYSSYLHFFYLQGSGEVAIVCAAMFGAAIGFLWYNAYPAETFMGDTGSQALGGALGTLAVLLKSELLFLIVGGVFVAQAFSVLIQEKIGINWIGRRFFYRAPLHYTFLYGGIGETKVVVRFWIASGILALIGLATLKIR